ncbi:GMC oxidoreductase [Calothrix sp. PCC 7507]|uniref:GMC oxidoreductase n=1 Tax=Calothrix sp. PCC 7507 TaxID=99598 RepID=UPI00029EF23C|nr:GMC family oxidoreductase [Calothrix sp. PCC 7507]AFY35647.1 GMC oxidoreductase [Calothrix sp. PCC 7507]
MKFNDLRQLEDDLVIETDLCIVGSGFAGLSIAKEFANTKTEVWVIESGGLSDEPDTQSLYEIESVGAPRVMNQDVIRYRILGGTSHIWTGRCAPFDNIDFQQRSWVPYSGWPITRDSLENYLERAGENLRIGPNCYDERLWEQFKVPRPTPLLNEKLVRPQFWQFSRENNYSSEPVRFRNQAPDAPNIHFLLHANVTHINTNEAGNRVESVEVSTLEKKRAQIKAKVILLCCGGIENARLLLASNRTVPYGVGNQNDMVGRFLMDHPGAIVGTFDQKKSDSLQDRFGHYWLDDQQGRHTYLQGIALSSEIQEQEQLLNCAAFVEVPPASDDPASALRELKSAFKNKQLTKKAYEDAIAVLRQPMAIAQGFYRRLVQNRPPIPKADAIYLTCLVEQLPDPESRVTLSNRTDALGMPLSQLNWKISEQERQTVRRLAHLIHQEFQRLGLPQPKLSEWLDAKENWQTNFTDRAHPTGTTRMSVNPKQGVVDENGQVHGVEGLFIAGSSVFPTTGHANSTLMLIALSIRLADWLKVNQFNSASVQVSRETVAIVK